ncbi:hypothetical protein GCM10028803_41850 [Larkinella knui]|uniref:HEAT repeat domain-containing protein n=1 Tax=Larkinella knui TaxID=2025310 RepID=A0A3P1CNF1_9BACT|nr:HEAT repeat domain-containing protein [Larkinella knui]RRB14815.1 HEAT repeat domain-containing protein [Larkinella knui]
METTRPLTRPSRLVELDKFEAIKIRMDLNQKLMSGSCAFSKPLDLTFSEPEIQVLKVMATERFSVNTLLRKQAIYALGKHKSVETIDELMRLAQTDHEENVIRCEALQAIHTISPEVGRVVMEKMLTAGVPDLSLFIVRYLSQSGEPEGKQMVDRFLALKKNLRIRRALEQVSKPAGKHRAPKPDRNLNGQLH